MKSVAVCLGILSLFWINGFVTEARPQTTNISVQPTILKPKDALGKEIRIFDHSNDTPLSDSDYTTEEKGKLLSPGSSEEITDISANNIRLLPLDLPPSKAVLVLELLLNITINSCPQVDTKFTSAVNKFMRAMLFLRLKSQEERKLSKLEGYFYDYNIDSMTSCYNYTKMRLQNSNMQQPEYEAYFLHVPENERPIAVVRKEQKRSKRDATKDGSIFDSAEVVSRYLNSMSDVMRLACMDVGLPMKMFIHKFINEMANTVTNYADKEHMEVALEKHWIMAIPVIKQIIVCSNELSAIERVSEESDY